MKTTTELLIQALETPYEKGGGVCEHILHALRGEHLGGKVCGVLEMFKTIAMKTMDYPLSAQDTTYWLFPLDSKGDYQVPVHRNGDLYLDGKSAEYHYMNQEEDPLGGPLGQTRLKLIKDVLTYLKSRVEIFVDHSNCYLLDDLIVEHNLKWNHPREKRLEEYSVMNNYLVIDLGEKRLMWSENRHYILVDLQELKERLKPIQGNKNLKAHTASVLKINQLTNIYKVYGYRFNETQLGGTSYLDNELKSLTSHRNLEDEMRFHSEDQYEDVMDLLTVYCRDMDKKDFQGFLIKGSNLNWRGSDGFAEVRSTDPVELFGKLVINGSYTLKIDRMFDDTLEVSLSHHDANSSFIVVPGVVCDFDEVILTGEEIELARAYAAIISLLGLYHYEYVSEQAYEERIEDFTQELNETVAEVFVELGTNITYTLAENLMKLNEEIENGI